MRRSRSRGSWGCSIPNPASRPSGLGLAEDGADERPRVYRHRLLCHAPTLPPSVTFGYNPLHELRIYTAHPGKLPALQARFRDHTVGIFERCGIKNVAYWTNSIGGRSDELWYVIAFEDMAQRDEAWATFISDPEWRQVRAASEEAGPLVHHIENRILAPTDFSPLR